MNKNLDEKRQGERQAKVEKNNENIANKLVEELLEKVFNKKMSITVSLRNSPRQRDLTSCGLFVIEYMRALSQGGEVTADRRTSKDLREHILAELEEGRIKKRENSQDPKEGTSRMYNKDNKETAKRKRDYKDDKEDREGSMKKTRREYSNSKESMDKKQQDDESKEERDDELEVNISRAARQELERSKEEINQELENGLGGKEKSWVNTQDMRRSVLLLIEEKIKEVQFHQEEGAKAFEELKYHSETLKKLMKNLEGHLPEDV